MNVFNRLVLLLVALLLVAVPVLLLLVAFGVIPADVVNEYTGYRVGLQALGGFSASSLTTVTRLVTAILGVLLALVALLLLLRELTFGRLVSRSTVMDDTPGKETIITANAVKTLAESAAREVGADAPSVSLASDDRSYVIFCGIMVPSSGNYAELAALTKENIRRVLEDQSVPVKDVEVTVSGTSS